MNQPEVRPNHAEPEVEWSLALAFEPSTRPLYLEIVRVVSLGIREGHLSPGDRLPTHRELASELGVARTTVRKGYEELEQLGLIEGTVGRGTFVRVPTMRAAPADGPRIDLRMANWRCGPAPDFASALQQLGRLSESLDVYDDPDRRARAMAAAQRWLAEHKLNGIEPSRSFLTTGVQHGLFASLLAQPAGDRRVAVDRFTYPGFLQAANSLGWRITPVPADEEGMSPACLEQAASEGARFVYLMPTIQNPTSVSMTRSRRDELVDIISSRNLTLIEDESLRALAGDAPPPLANRLSDQTIYLAGFSKSVCPGVRAGFAHVPDGMRNRFADALFATTLFGPSLSIEAAAHWILSGNAGSVAQRKARSNSDLTIAFAASGAFDLGQCTPGSPYLWIPVPPGASSVLVAQEARRHGLGVLPSRMFSVEDSIPVDAVRISIAAAHDKATARQAGEILADVLSRDSVSPKFVV